MVRCRDEVHRPQFYSNWEKKWWCPHAKDFSKTELAARYPDGRSVNWLRLCEKTGKVVVHNKKCDAGLDPLKEKGRLNNAL